MPTPTYEPIASVTLGSNTSTVSFNSIPQNYKHLVISLATWNTDASQAFWMKFNNSSSAHVVSHVIGAGGSRNTMFQDNSSFRMLYNSIVPAWNNDTCSFVIHINDYANTSKSPNFIAQYRLNFQSGMVTGTMADYAAVSTITFSTGGGSFVAGGTFNLWGLHG